MYLTPRIFITIVIMKLMVETAFSSLPTWTNDYELINQTISNNVSYSENDNPSSSESQWLTYFNAAQAAMTAMGLLLNLLTFVTFIKNGEMFSGVIRALLKHQAFMDMLVCVMGILTLAIPPMQVVGDNAASLLICQVFHSQSLYWSIMLVSIMNLEVIAIERFYAIAFPFKHAKLTRGHIHKIIAALYPISPLSIILAFLQVHYEDGVCKPEFFFSSQVFHDMMRGFSVWCFLIIYAFPCAIFFVAYGGIVVTLYARQRQSNLASSRVIDAATTQLTRTAAVVTIWYIIALGYDCWYYVLGYNGVVKYVKNAPIQKVGIFLAVSNSCVNPIIYALCMPAYRESVRRTLGCSSPDKKRTTTNSQSSSSATVKSVA